MNNLTDDWTASLIDRLNEFARENSVDFAEVRTGREASSVIQVMHGRYNALRTRAEQAESKLLEWENREAGCCPENTPFEQVIAQQHGTLGANDFTIDDLRGRLIRLIKEKEQAEAKCAAKDHALRLVTICPTCDGSKLFTPECGACLGGDPGRCKCAEMTAEACPECEGSGRLYSGVVEHAISTDCGTGWRSPEDYAKLEAKVAKLQSDLDTTAQSYFRELEAVDKSKCFIEGYQAKVNVLRCELQVIANGHDDPKRIAKQALAATATEEES